MKLEKEVTVIPVSNTRVKKIAIDATFFTLQKYISVGTIERTILLKKCKKTDELFYYKFFNGFGFFV